MHIPQSSSVQLTYSGAMAAVKPPCVLSDLSVMTGQQSCLQCPLPGVNLSAASSPSVNLSVPYAGTPLPKIPRSSKLIWLQYCNSVADCRDTDLGLMSQSSPRPPQPR